MEHVFICFMRLCFIFCVGVCKISWTSWTCVVYSSSLCGQQNIIFGVKFCFVGSASIIFWAILSLIWGCSKGRLTLQCFCNNIVFVLVKQQIRVATQVKRRVRAVKFVKNNLSTATLETQPEFTTNRNSHQYFNNNYWITLKKKKVKLLNMDWSGKVKISDFWF